MLHDRGGSARHPHPPVLHALSYNSPADLLASREAIAHWARMSYGYMGRTPDYKASFMATLGAGDAGPDFYAPFGDSARHWYRKYAEQVLFLNHVLINPPIDRDKAVHEVEDVYVHVIRERDDGIVVSRRQDARHRLGLHPRDVRRPEQRRPARGGPGRGLRARVHRADGHAGQEADLAQLLRVGARARRGTTRSRPGSTRTTPS